MAKAPYLLEHAFALAVDGGIPIKVSILNAAAVVLVCRGADEILIPAPTEIIQNSVELSISQIPEDRRSSIRIVDKRGLVRQRVVDYLKPLTTYASKWPENTFVDFSHNFLYDLLLATKERAGIISDSISIVREFVPIIDVRLFRGEARFRLAELIRLIAAYEPIQSSHATILSPFAEEMKQNEAIKIIESTEFRTLTLSSGLLGYLSNPRQSLRRIKRLFRDIVDKKRVKALFDVASSVGEVGALASVTNGVSKIIDFASSDTRNYAPVFLPLGSAQLGIYYSAIREASISAKPQPGSIMTFEHSSGAISWLNVGEENKLIDEEAAGISRLLEEVKACRAVQKRFF